MLYGEVSERMSRFKVLKKLTIAYGSFVAVVRTPSVRIETESGRLLRTVPPERNLVRFALTKPQNAEEWLLGHASTFE
jgi:hypothetical protein